MAKEKARSPKRPKKVKVGYATYDIEWREHDDWPAHDQEAMGVTYANQCRILIRLSDEDTLKNERGYHDIEQKQCLVHELMHAVYHVTNLSKIIEGDVAPTEREELSIATLSPVLLAVLRDNPKVLLYLLT